MYKLSNGENIFHPRWPLKVKGQGQTPKSLRSSEYLKNGISEGQKSFFRSNPWNLEVKYLKNSIRDRRIQISRL